MLDLQHCATFGYHKHTANLASSAAAAFGHMQQLVASSQGCMRPKHPTSRQHHIHIGSPQHQLQLLHVLLLICPFQAAALSQQWVLRLKKVHSLQCLLAAAAIEYSCHCLVRL